MLCLKYITRISHIPCLIQLFFQESKCVWYTSVWYSIHILHNSLHLYFPTPTNLVNQCSLITSYASDIYKNHGSAIKHAPVSKAIPLNSRRSYVWMRNYIPHGIVDMITYICHNFIQSRLIEIPAVWHVVYMCKRRWKSFRLLAPNRH